MIVLLGIGLLAGVITAISPCVLPVLPILLAGGASGGQRRPYAIIGGLVASFTFFTLATAWIIHALGLPQDLLRDIAIALLFVLAATLLVPQIGLLLERPFARLTRRRGGDLGGGLVLGASLGLFFVPCARPVLATVTVLSAQRKIGLDTALLTLAYALGAAIPMLLVALGGRSVAQRIQARGTLIRRTSGVLMAAAAVALVFNVEQNLQIKLGGYTNAIQKHVEETGAAKKQLAKLNRTDQSAAFAAIATASPLQDLGPAPEFRGISSWLNTPGNKPLSLAALRGKVVLIDFWTYSCINCLRTLPHLESWDRAYRKDGLVIVGVHTPEFAFEHVLSNVRKATKDLGVRYPVALDNSYGTWNAYANQYWPAEYFIDRLGHVRRAHFGEGEYGKSEQTIRSLLAEGHVSVPKRTTALADTTPTGLLTPETYLGGARLDRYVGSPISADRMAAYRFPAAIPQNGLAYAGRWKVGGERILAGEGARLRIRFHARNVYLVLGGHGRVQTLVDGRPFGSTKVTADKLYTLVHVPSIADGLLELRFTPGVDAYAFTFG
ncbi:MAG: cytochrome c biogenesis protein DipZ [Gaiellaceae bacterium]